MIYNPAMKQRNISTQIIQILTAKLLNCLRTGRSLKNQIAIIFQIGSILFSWILIWRRRKIPTNVFLHQNNELWHIVTPYWKAVDKRCLAASHQGYTRKRRRQRQSKPRMSFCTKKNPCGRRILLNHSQFQSLETNAQ